MVEGRNDLRAALVTYRALSHGPCAIYLLHPLSLRRASSELRAFPGYIFGRFPRIRGGIPAIPVRRRVLAKNDLPARPPRLARREKESESGARISRERPPFTFMVPRLLCDPVRIDF